MYEMAKHPDKQIGHQSDGTTKHLIHWGAHAVRLSDENDPTKSNLFTLTVSPVASGRADDTVIQLEKQFTEMEDIAEELGIDPEFLYSVDRIGTRMSDRAANEKKVTKVLIERKKDLLRGNPEWDNMSELEQEQRTRIYSFTCAAHKIHNMASAMTAASLKELYLADEIDASVRGMKGASKHIYEVNKLLCEHSRKEYALGSEFKAHNLCTGVESGSSLFKPIVGNRYLIFLHNAIPTLSSKDMVLLFLEDVKDGKEKVGLNRLEHSVRSGYLDIRIESEEVAYSLMYHQVCSKLLAKAKTAKCPLELNEFYGLTIDALGLWSVDPTTLIDGTEEMWPGSTGDDFTEEMMQRVRVMGDPDLVSRALKVMAKAGMEKLASHAEEHLPGGMYHQPTNEMEEAAATIGEATNDRIESMFGMLDRRLTFAPTSNPINVSHFIAAKTDKVVQWMKETVTDAERICDVARKFSVKERKREGTKDAQLKRLYEQKKERKEDLIRRRRKKRLDKEKMRLERLANIHITLVRDIETVASLTCHQLCEQNQLWRLLSASPGVKSLDLLKQFSSVRALQKKNILIQIIQDNVNVQLHIDNGNITVDMVDTPTDLDIDGEWCTSDEETLDISAH